MSKIIYNITNSAEYKSGKKDGYNKALTDIYNLIENYNISDVNKIKDFCLQVKGNNSY